MLSNIMFWEKKYHCGLKVWHTLYFKLSLNPNNKIMNFLWIHSYAICLGLSIYTTFWVKRDTLLSRNFALLSSQLSSLKWFVTEKMLSHHAPLYINILISWKFIYIIFKNLVFQNINNFLEKLKTTYNRATQWDLCQNGSFKCLLSQQGNSSINSLLKDCSWG